MRWRFVSRQLGFLLLLLSAAMLPSVAGSAYYYFGRDWAESQNALLAMLASAVIGAAVGLLLLRRGRRGETQIFRREALLLVALSWVLGAALAALPFYLWASLHTGDADPGFRSFGNCYFEAMSGLTTTGASILRDIESIPRSLLLWRAFIQWLGGLGIIVLFVAILPILGVGGKRLFRFEAPGPTKEGVRPRIRAAAQMLWIIYVVITLAELISLKLCGLGWFDACCHSFTTMATGGFSTKNTSITGLSMLAGHRVEIIITLFMFMAGINFAAYDLIVAGRWREALRHRELHVYVAILLAATAALAWIVHDQGVTNVAGAEEPGLWATVRHSLFCAVSLQTTTGFCTADFNQWSFPAKGLLVGLMFVGACAGSTGGGIKVIRFILLAKVLLAELEAVFRPNVVRPIRVGRSTIDPQMRSGTLVYFVLIGTIVVASTGLILCLEPSSRLAEIGADPAVTAFTAVAATLNNIGPGLDMIGPTGNYADFRTPTKILLCLLMALGRLELYAFLVLFVPVFWRET